MNKIKKNLIFYLKAINKPKTTDFYLTETLTSFMKLLLTWSYKIKPSMHSEHYLMKILLILKSKPHSHLIILPTFLRPITRLTLTRSWLADNFKFHLIKISLNLSFQMFLYPMLWKILKMIMIIIKD